MTTEHDLIRQRLRQAGLTAAPHSEPAEVVRWLLAVQSQDFGPALWALSLRLGGGTEDSLGRVFDDGVFLRTHVLRPTWHFVLPEDLRWLLDLTAARIQAGNEPYYQREGLDGPVRKRANDLIGTAVADGRHRTRAELATVLAEGGIVVERFALGYLLMNAELDGIVCSGRRSGRQQTYALLDERAPASAPGARSLGRDEALVELVTRYFTSHGPATEKDLASWATSTLTDIRAGIAAAGDRLEQVEIDGVRYWRAPGTVTPPADRAHRAFLLQGYDEYTVAYTQSKRLLDLTGEVVPSFSDRPVYNGVVIMDSQVVGHWRRTTKARSVVIDLGLYRALDADEHDALTAAAEDVGRFVERPVDLRVAAL